MTHGLTRFQAQTIIDKAKSVLDVVEDTVGGDGEVGLDAIQEGLRALAENQIEIAETLDLIKKEFDKFEEGLSKIL